MFSNLASLGSNVVCSSYPTDEASLCDISSLRSFNVTGVTVGDTPVPCLCDSPLLGKDLHEICHRRGWDLFWKAHKEKVTNGTHTATDNDEAWKEYWKDHWTTYWAGYWDKYWSIRYSWKLTHGERATQSGAMEAHIEEEMKGWKAKLIGMGLVNASAAPCPGGPAVMSAGGTLADGDTAPDCQTTPGACSANAYCMPISTAHRYLCLSVT
jgi:hypothetical protein